MYFGNFFQPLIYKSYQLADLFAKIEKRTTKKETQKKWNEVEKSAVKYHFKT